jgi:hypothetical protein
MSSVCVDTLWYLVLSEKMMTDPSRRTTRLVEEGTNKYPSVVQIPHSCGRIESGNCVPISVVPLMLCGCPFLVDDGSGIAHDSSDVGTERLK